ncbi:uncharacterized protein LOC108680069 [Hyalella azteca]|uniref:Uncharacterized protein LOC108680069 n=1 Tax=Hyalella azteca TaxID=294128 RepID=A0A979FMP3_HYAAZ|nr:uncharacterized protein LOC108680069 [Hyalella azteca]
MPFSGGGSKQRSSFGALQLSSFTNDPEQDGRSSPLRLLRTVIPDYALRGGSARLTCDYDAGESSLYSVRWFKDDLEFYRYVPRSVPSYQVFQRQGFVVDEGASEASHVVARGLQFEASGQYRCEVSAEGPEFTTVIGHGTMLVLDPPRSGPSVSGLQQESKVNDSVEVTHPPRSGPSVSGLQQEYKVNDSVEVTCTSSPSHPPAHLSWLLNGRQVSEEESVTVSDPLEQPGGLLVRVSSLRFTATQEHFQDGRLTVKCLASLAPPGYPSAASDRASWHSAVGTATTSDNNISNKKGKQPVRDKAKFLDSRLLEQQKRAMMHFFYTWETSVTVSSATRHHFTAQLLVMATGLLLYCTSY